MPFCGVEDTRSRQRSWEQTTTGFWCTTAGRPTTVSRWLSIKVVWPTCSSGVGRWRRSPVGGGKFSPGGRELLQTSLELRDRYERGEISETACAVPQGEWRPSWSRCWRSRIDIQPTGDWPRHLEHERSWLFTFLYCPGLDSTNNAAERAIRGMVIARKVWGGSRTWEGARTQQILGSVPRTCWQHG